MTDSPQVLKQHILHEIEQLTIYHLLEILGFIRFLRSKKVVSYHAKEQPKTLPKALGLLATSAPPPTDYMVDKWLEEHRMEKYR